MPAATSRRTAWPKRRRCSSSSTAASRSWASSSSTDRSALRVTRKTWCSAIAIAGKRLSRWAAITCSTGHEPAAVGQGDEPGQERRAP